VRRATATPAILLRSVAYGEADRIVTLLTESHGKVALIARSARKSQKRFGAALEPFALIEAEIAVGSGEVGRLASARLIRGYPRILGSLQRIEIAGAALEMIRDIVPLREPDPRFVVAITRFFERLDQEDAIGREIALALELRALALAGLSPRFDACGRCGAHAGDRAALFDPTLGAIVCRACGGGPILLSGAARARMIACAHDTWCDDARGWSDRERGEATEAIDAFVRRHLGQARAREPREEGAIE
jgi:DNA repair protein RecO (recombination protein O)